MTKVQRLFNKDDIEREASEWIARLNADDVSADDRVRFEAWLNLHARHRGAYEALSHTWNRFLGAGRIARAVSLGNAINESTGDKDPYWTTANRRPCWKVPASLAAAFAIAAIGLVWWFTPSSPENRFETTVGEHASVSLPDGSSLELNSNSAARLDYSGKARIVRLERGEAYFKVAHDAQRPFWVVAGNSWVRALGTAFNVYMQATGVRVTVTEGVVKVTAADRSFISQAPNEAVLKAGEQIDVREKVLAVRALQTAEMTRANSWRQGLLHFDNQPLADVITEMNRYTQLRISIDGESLRQLPVGGTFQASPQGAETLISTLEDGLHLQIQRDGQDVRITR